MTTARKKRGRLDADALFQYAVMTLAGRAQSSGELRAKLAARAERAEDIAPTLARLKQYGYLDDRRFAENYAGVRLEAQGLGAIRVMRDLRARRVSGAVAEKVVRQAYEGVDELALIEAFVDRRVLRSKPGSMLADQKELATAYRKLLRAGFSSGNILRVLKRRAQDPVLVEDLEPLAEEERDADR
jgi:regulatory protein